jgi:ABC-type oligopeptide transport system substrate-binding subunit
MKKYFMLLLLLGVLLLEACAPKPQYQTRSGKKKLKHYNSIQYQQPQPTP